ncbi:MAG: oligosaccharide flippase family protein [Bacteroidales bacterium]|nr:oligosaccharide flippase family protein [Bacteroidales bacterium]
MIKKIRESEFYRHVLTIISGSTLAQLIPLISEPVIVRLFSPVELGVLALFLSVSTIFSSIATARYEMAIVLPKKDEIAVNILALSLFITLAMSFLSGIIVWLFDEKIAAIANSPSLVEFLKFVPLYVLVAGVFQSFNQWATRKKYFKNIAISKISQSSTNAAVTMSTGAIGWNALGLIWGQISGWFAGSLPLIFKFYKRDRSLVSSVNKKEIAKQAKVYADFPKVNSAHIMSDIGQQSLVNFIIANFFSDRILGFYSRMIRIVKVPAGFIGTAVGQVFFQKASEQWQQEKNIRNLFLSNLKIMSVLGIPIFLILAVFGPQIFGFVLGEDWEIAGYYAQLLSPWLLLNFMISPFTHIPLIVNKQRKFFLLSLSMNVLVIIAFLMGYYINGSIESALILMSSFQVVFHIYLGIWFYRITK